MIEVDVESNARGDEHIVSSFTRKAIAVPMNAWKCSCLDLRALVRMMRVVEYNQLTVIVIVMVIVSQQNSMDDDDDDD